MFTINALTPTRIALLLLVGVSLLNLVYNAYLPIHPDEAYYWYWSQRPELGYFDHPPMVAYLIGLFTFFSDHVFFIRLVALASVVVSALFLYRLTAEIADEKAALYALILYLCLPVTQLSATITTPDSALLIFWSGALYYGYRALFGGKLPDIYLTGIFLGLGLASKLPMILLVGILGLMILLKRRTLLASCHTWAAFGLVFVLFGGVLYWNAGHEWISFTFQYAHGSTKAFALSFDAIAEYLIGLVLLLTPLLFLFALYLLAKSPLKTLSGGEKYLLFIAAFILAFFGYKALFKPMALNWYAPALLTLIPFLAIRIREFGMRRMLVASAGVALIFSFVGKFPSLVMPKKTNPEYALFGYEEAVSAFKEYLGDYQGPLCSDYYSTTAILNYFLPDYPGYISSRLTPRPNMYTIWEMEARPAIDACYAFVEREKIVTHLKQKCAAIDTVHKTVIPGTTTRDKTFFFFRCLQPAPLGESVLELRKK
jgi:4-amino-4-deoxy-L-arabinose transferase-like glycosyltransferase